MRHEHTRTHRWSSRPFSLMGPGWILLLEYHTEEDEEEEEDDDDDDDESAYVVSVHGRGSHAY